MKSDEKFMASFLHDADILQEFLVSGDQYSFLVYILCQNLNILGYKKMMHFSLHIKYNRPNAEKKENMFWKLDLIALLFCGVNLIC